MSDRRKESPLKIRMKLHTTPCTKCKAQMICDNPECSEADHVCYACLFAARVLTQALAEGARRRIAAPLTQ